MLRSLIPALVGLVFLFVGGLAAGLPSSFAQGANSNNGATVTLKEVLEKGLQARRPQEFAFIQTVVTKVDGGELSRDVVESTFLWARRHRAHPFQYFEQGLKIRAKKLGVPL